MPDFTPTERLARMLASTEEPTLSDDELADLLRFARRPDSAGNAPSDPAWTPRYNLKAAAAEGWRWKAARAAALYSSGTDVSQDSESDVFKHCMAMVAEYEGGESGSAKVKGAIDDDAFLYLDTRAINPVEIIP